MIPIIAPVLIKAHSSWCTYFLFTISFIVSILSAILVHATVPAYFSIITFYLLELIVVYDNESTLRQLYFNFINGEEHFRMKLKTIQEREILLVRGEELSSFYGNVAHDLKSPLQGFTIELETLETNFTEMNSCASGAPQGQWKESIVVLKSICSFMLMTINRAIDYSKASSGILLVPTLESINISDAINWVVSCVSPLNDMPIKIDSFPEVMCPTVVTDKHWFMENLLCLVSNALKFTVDGSVHIRCSLQSNTLKSGLLDADEEDPPINHPPPLHSLPRPADQSPMYRSISDTDCYSPQGGPSHHAPSMLVLMEVEDAGGEANFKDHVNLFQPYKQSERREGGTGIGLYSILKRVEALGGSCGVKPRRDGTKGSRFWFSFPYQPQDSSPLQQQQQLQQQPSPSLSIPSPCHDDADGQDDDHENIRPPSPTASDLHRERTEEEEPPNSPTILLKDSTHQRRILLVDDSVLIQKTTSRALTKEGYVVDIARNGLECLEMVKEHDDYGFILMDIQMPVMDGIEATKRLRDMEQHQQGQHDDDRSVEKEELEKTEGMKMPCHHRHLIIGVSANADSVTPKLALAAGMDAFLSKPLSMKVLKETFLRLASSSPPLTHAPSPHPPVDNPT